MEVFVPLPLRLQDLHGLAHRCNTHAAIEPADLR
jgi:hypothetical protein